MIAARSEQGFTLVELLVTMAITTIVFGATLTVLDVFQRDNSFAQQRNEAQDKARTAQDRLARQLRSVAAPTTGAAGALELAEPYSVIFQTIDPSAAEAGENSTHAMRVRYCLNDSTPTSEVLWSQVQRWKTKAAPALPTGTACPDESGAWDSSSQLVQHVTNRNGGQERPVFIYAAATVPSIASLEMDLFIDLNPGSRPGETELTSGVSLRNVNRPPVASFTATNVSGHVRLNASESEDPDGLALTYKWWKDGTELTTTAQEYETPEKESKGTHTYKLAVSDPGGLSSETERTVTIP